jgi:hypothetical protein
MFLRARLFWDAMLCHWLNGSQILRDHSTFIFRVKQSLMDSFTLKMGEVWSIKMLGANQGDIETCQKKWIAKLEFCRPLNDNYSPLDKFPTLIIVIFILFSSWSWWLLIFCHILLLLWLYRKTVTLLHSWCYFEMSFWFLVTYFPWDDKSVFQCLWMETEPSALVRLIVEYTISTA